MTWRPLTENPFPWTYTDVILLAFWKDDPTEVEVFRAICADGGSYYPKNGGLLTFNEMGWIPFAWQLDDCPARDDERFPPKLTDGPDV